MENFDSYDFFELPLHFDFLAAYFLAIFNYILTSNFDNSHSCFISQFECLVNRTVWQLCFRVDFRIWKSLLALCLIFNNFAIYYLMHTSCSICFNITANSTVKKTSLTALFNFDRVWLCFMFFFQSICSLLKYHCKCQQRIITSLTP